MVTLLTLPPPVQPETLLPLSQPLWPTGPPRPRRRRRAQSLQGYPKARGEHSVASCWWVVVVWAEALTRPIPSSGQCPGPGAASSAQWLCPGRARIPRLPVSGRGRGAGARGGEWVGWLLTQIFFSVPR